MRFLQNLTLRVVVATLKHCLGCTSAYGFLCGFALPYEPFLHEKCCFTSFSSKQPTLRVVILALQGCLRCAKAECLYAHNIAMFLSYIGRYNLTHIISLVHLYPSSQFANLQL